MRVLPGALAEERQRECVSVCVSVYEHVSAW